MKESNSNDPIVSVIIPIYNVKRHIVKGLQVLNKQHFRDFEIILIDDGSTDGSSEICDAASDKNAQIKVLHKTNGGAGSARNMGIDYACGKYIYFFDIDDELKPSLLEYCVAKMEELKLDMLWFGFETIDVTHSNKCDTISFKEHLIQSNKELKECYIDELLLIPNGNGFPWNKFYRKDFLDRHHLRFENQRIQQDEVFNLLVYPHVERAYISPDVLYT